MSPASLGKMTVDVEVRTKVKRPSPWDRHPALANALDLGIVVSLVLAAWIVAIAFGYGLWHLFGSVFL